MLEHFLISALVGVFAGLLAGTLGLGGGVVVVPALLYLFRGMGFDDQTLAQQAVATSLATISITSVSAIASHYRLRLLRATLVRRLVPGVAVGAFLGALLASALPGMVLMRLFGVLAIAVALQMLLSGRRKQMAGSDEALPAAPVMLGAATLVGTVAGMFGIGGGSMTVPLLNGLWRVRIQEAVAASAACGLPIALAGCLGFIWSGQGLVLPAGSVGFVYLPAVAGIVVTSFPLAWLGAHIAHRLPALTLKRIFSGALLLIGLKLVVD